MGGAFELLLWLLVILNRRRWGRISVVFGINTAILGCAERLNKLGGAHWKAFATQDYFDTQGAFLGVVLGVPLLLCQLLIVFFLLREAAVMVVKVKRMELRTKFAEKQKEEKKEK